MWFSARAILHRCHLLRATGSQEGIRAPLYYSKAFLIFIDLRKAYDSVPHAALLLALEVYGVPGSLIQLIDGFHSGMPAAVRVDGDVSGSISVENGLRQGCVMAPLLFNLYFGLVLEAWRTAIAAAGVNGVSLISSIHGNGNLFPKRTRQTGTTSINDLGFADDAALLAPSRESAQLALERFSKRCFFLRLDSEYSEDQVHGRWCKFIMC